MGFWVVLLGDAVVVVVAVALDVGAAVVADKLGGLVPSVAFFFVVSNCHCPSLFQY